MKVVEINIDKHWMRLTGWLHGTAYNLFIFWMFGSTEMLVLSKMPFLDTMAPPKLNTNENKLSDMYHMKMLDVRALPHHLIISLHTAL